MKKLPKKNFVSISKGFWFVFIDGTDEIIAGGSAFSGKESVYFNKELISQQRSMKKTSRHKFARNTDEYEIVFHVLEIMKGKIECILYKNDIVVKRYKSHVDHKFNFKTLLKYIALGVVYGLVSSIFNLPVYAAVIFIIALIIASVAKTMRSIVIEEV